MCDPIKMKETNHRSRYAYVKSMERAKTVVNMVTRVEIVRRENKTSTVRTITNMDTLLNNVTSRRIMGKNTCTVTRRVVKKRSDGRKKT